MSQWRVGRKLGRTLYRDEVCAGMVDTPALAADIVATMNGVTDNNAVPRGHCGRCDRCGWRLAQPGADGCHPGNCSHRPLPRRRDTCAGCGARLGAP